MPRHHHRDQSAGGPSQRQLRVGELIRHALAEMLSRGEVHDPVIEAPHDHGAGGAHDAGPAACDHLRDAARRPRRERRCSPRSSATSSFLRGEIAHRVNLKFAPEIRFRIDERFDEAERIEKLLRTPEVRRDLDKPEGDLDQPESDE